MRRHLPYARTALSESSENSTAARPGHSGWIATLSSAADLPDREPLRPVKSVRDERSGHAVEGGFVADLSDGRPIYPEAPAPVKSGDPILRLRRRLTRPAWIFVLLAVAQAVTILADFAATRVSPASVVDLGARVAYTAAVTLLPVAVLVWRRDALRSAALVLAGTILWTTAPAAAGLAWWAVRHSGAMALFGAEVSVAVAAVGVAACFGPAVVALGLDRLRGAKNPFRESAICRLVVALVPWSMYVWFTPGSVGSAPTGLLDPLHLPATVSGAALPFSVLCLLMLTWTCLTALGDEERPRQFWQFAACGTTVLLAVAITEGTMVNLGGSPAVAGLAARNWDAAAGIALPLVGVGLLTLGFASPVWSRSPDTASWREMPDEVFAWGVAGDTAGAGRSGIDRAGSGAIVTVAAGVDHALAVDESGQVIAWGADDARQTDVPPGLSGVVDVAAGDGFSLALRRDGTVVGWGANDGGQLDIPPGLDHVVAITAGDSFAVALRSDGTVAGWGAPAEAVPAGAALGEVVAIAAGARHCLALRRDGRVVAWGDDGAGESSVPKTLTDVVGIAAGRGFSLALRRDGTVVGWGDNSYGQLDVPATLRGVVSIAAGAYHALALTARGDVVAWGGGGRSASEGAHPWRLLDFKAVAAGHGFSLAVRAA